MVGEDLLHCYALLCLTAHAPVQCMYYNTSLVYTKAPDLNERLRLQWHSLPALPAEGTAENCGLSLIAVRQRCKYVRILALLFLYITLNMFRMLIHPSSGACDLCVELFRGLHWSGSMCVGVTLWYGCGGVVSICRLKHSSASTCIWIPHHHSHTTT